METRREDELRLVTVLFADVSGFTALSERLSPEDVRAFQNDLFPRMTEIITGYDGFIEKYIGDAIVAAFGAPVAHENDPERALRAALAMRERMEEVSARWAPAAGRPLVLHIGVNTGGVVAGQVGGGEGSAYAVTGDTTNTAARLQSAAHGGQIVVGPDTWRLTQHLFEFRPLEPLRLKGKAEPIAAYELIGLLPEAGPRRGLEQRGITSPLVGREDELATLTACVERLSQGESGLVAVLGEAGLGKSRLTAEVRRRAGERVRWLEGRALSYSQSISFWPFLEILRRDSGIEESDGAAAGLAKLEGRLRALLAEDAPDVLPYLATLLALDVPQDLAERVKYLDGDAMRRQLFISARRYFAALASERPLVLVFEDLHWADQSSAELLEHLLPLIHDHPLLICGVSRPDPESAGARLRQVALESFPDRYTEVRLAPLTEERSAELLDNLLRADGLPARVRQQILEKSEGNPFFVEEVIRTLIDLGGVVRDERTGRWRATATLEALAIPDTIQGVIMARIDRLDDDVKQALRLASVVGRTFWARVLEALSDAAQALERSLGELQQLELIREKARDPELEFIFKHVLVQEATYESILVRRRKELHQRVGEALERLFPERLDEFYGLLAYHYARAEHWEKAQEYMLKAGDQAGKMAADAEALKHYREAMEVHARAFGDAWDPFQRAVLERKIGEALFRRGEHEAATQTMYRALGLHGRSYPTAQRGLLGATLGELAVQVRHRLLPGRHVKPVAAEPDPRAEELSHIYHMLSWIDYFADPVKLVLDVLCLLNVSERHGIPLGMVRGLMGAGLVCNHIPLPRQALAYHRRAVALAEAQRLPLARGQAHMGMAYHNEFVGTQREALHHYRESAGAYLEVGEIRGWGPSAMRVAWLPMLAEGWEECLALARKMVALGQDGADQQLVAWGTFATARAVYRSGDLEESAALLQRAVALFKLVPDYMFVAVASGELGQCYLRQGRLEDAIATLEDAGRTLEAHNAHAMLNYVARNAMVEAYLAAAEQEQDGQPAQRGRRKRFLTLAQRAWQKARKEGMHVREGSLGVLRLRGTYEWLAGNRRAAAAWWQRSLAASEDYGSRYHAALALLEQGRYLEDADALRRAETIFDELGAAYELAMTRRATRRHGVGRTTK